MGQTSKNIFSWQVFKGLSNVCGKAGAHLIVVRHEVRLEGPPGDKNSRKGTITEGKGSVRLNLLR